MEHLENVVKKDLRARKGMLERQVLLDVLAHQVPLEAKEIQETLVQSVPEETPDETAKGDLQEHLELPGLLVSVDQGVLLEVSEHQASLEILALLVRAVLPVNPDLPVTTEQTVRQGHQDLPDQWERLENRAFLEILAIQDPREKLDQLDHPDLREQRDLPVS